MPGVGHPRRLLVLMGGFGFLSGLPLPLTIFTLQQWFTTFGLSLHAIGLTSLIGLSYTLKFLWSPLFDRAPPGFLRHLGRRRGWLLVVQPLLAGACVALALSDPGRHVVVTVTAAALLGFFSASQDILIDAWRIESFDPRQQGTALAVYIWGYRGALLVSGSGVIFLSLRLGWPGAILCMAALMVGGMLVTLAAPEPVVARLPQAVGRFAARIEAAFVAPLRELLARPGFLWVLAFVLLFRVGKVLADTNAAGFYRYGLGFGSAAVAAANFLPSLGGSLVGAAFGGWLVARLGPARAVLLAGVLQAASLGLYLMLLAWPGEPALLAIKVGVEYFAGGAADTAFLSYLSGLCARDYTATQYAVLSSLAAIAFHTLGGLSGFGAEVLGYRDFYIGTMLLGLPALLILLRLVRRGSPQPPG